MTREELEMRTLVRESDVIDRTDGSELAKAFNYLWEKYVEQENCEDVISRQAAIDAINTAWTIDDLDNLTNAMLTDTIKSLPPVTPQESTDKSNLEKICEELSAENDDLRDQLAMRDRFQKQQPCNDARSLKAVLDIVDGYSESQSNVEDVTQDIISDIMALPPANLQKTKTGHWIDDKCSVCGKGIEDLIDSREWYRNEEPNFCPFCGLKLVESEEE